MDSRLNFSSLSRAVRQYYLEGPSIMLSIAYGDEPYSHAHQISAAKNISARDRLRQLGEQAKPTEQRTSPEVRLEFPLRALSAASPELANFLCDEKDPSKAQVHLCRILPGYLMDVLDWYCSSLRAHDWKDFLPTDPCIDGDDKFYWLYVYVAMRLVRMHGFAEKLYSFLKGLVEKHNIADEAWMLEQLLDHLLPDDPLLHAVAKRYVQLESVGLSPLSESDWSIIDQRYIDFATLVRQLRRLAAQEEAAMTEAALQMHRLGIGLAHGHRALES